MRRVEKLPLTKLEKFYNTITAKCGDQAHDAAVETFQFKTMLLKAVFYSGPEISRTE